MFGQGGVSADEGGDFLGQRRDAGDAVGLAAQFVVEGHGFQTIQPLGHGSRVRGGFGYPQVVFPEEAGVGQAGGQDLLVARKDRRAVVGGLRVGDGDEALDQARAGVFDREELLMRAHRGLQNFGRQMQEFRADPADQGDRPFDEARNFGEEASVGDHLPPGGEGEVLGGLPDGGLTLGRVQNHVSAFQFHGIVVEAGHREAGGTKETVACGGVGGQNALEGEGDHGGTGLVNQQAEDGVQRADPAQGAAAPAHGFGPGEIADGGFQHLGDDRRGAAARLFDHGEVNLRLFVVAEFQLVAVKAGRAQEAVEGSGGGVGARAFALLAHRAAFGTQAVDAQGQAARCRKRTGRGIGQASLDQTVGHQFLQILPGAGLHPGRDFLGEKFDQKVRHLRLHAGGELVPGKSPAIGENRNDAVDFNVFGVGQDVGLAQKCHRLARSQSLADRPGIKAGEP